jgi:DNA-binding transcriptional ArsR family regulator
VREHLLAFAWDEWAQMGLSGRRGPADTRAMDPEALLLFTIEIARLDPRLFDETLDWLATNGALLSLIRLSHLEARHPGDTNLVHAALAWASQASSVLHWRVPLPAHPPTSVEVFDPDVLSFISETDPTFSAFGFSRPPVRRSRKSEPPDYRLPINFAFQLRSLFGVGTRPEAVRILLTRDELLLDAAFIAQQASFTKRNVSAALLALVNAGVLKARWSGNERLFTTYRAKWARLLEHGETADSLPRFAPWIPLLRTLTAMHVWLEHHYDPSWSSYMVSSQTRQLVDSVASDLADLDSDLADVGFSLDRMDLSTEEGDRTTFERLVAALLTLTENKPRIRRTV